MESLKDKVDLLSGRILEPDAPPLSSDETKRASARLVQPLYKSIVRIKKDNAPLGQEYGLFSFTPAKGVQPNKYGVFGTAKLRGNYPTPEAANDAAEHIVRTIDSQNEIYTLRVGQEFPLTKEVKFAEDFENINLEKPVEEIERQRRKADAERTSKEKKTMVERERQLLEENKQILDETYEEDPLDIYIRERVKKSQLKWTLKETERKIEEEIKPAFQKVVDKVRELDQARPELKEQYLEKYMKSREEAGITTDTEFKETGTQQDFVKYLLDDD